jgi:hypothetical protein
MSNPSSSNRWRIRRLRKVSWGHTQNVDDEMCSEDRNEYPRHNTYNLDENDDAANFDDSIPGAYAISLQETLDNTQLPSREANEDTTISRRNLEGNFAMNNDILLDSDDDDHDTSDSQFPSWNRTNEGVELEQQQQVQSNNIDMIDKEVKNKCILDVKEEKILSCEAGF